MEPLFYEHLVPLSESLIMLNAYDVAESERETLENLIFSMFHHKIIETILTNVPAAAHEQVVQVIAEDPHNLEIMIFIKTLNPEIEDHIIHSGKELSDEIRGLLWKTIS